MDFRTAKPKANCGYAESIYTYPSYLHWALTPPQAWLKIGGGEPSS